MVGVPDWNAHSIEAWQKTVRQEKKTVEPTEAAKDEECGEQQQHDADNETNDPSDSEQPMEIKNNTTTATDLQSGRDIIADIRRKQGVIRFIFFFPLSRFE